MISLEFERRIGSNLAELTAIARAIAGWGVQVSLGQREIHHATLVIEELVTNAITHGLRGMPGEFWIRLDLQHDRLDIEIRDRAPAFDPFLAPLAQLSSSIDERAVGGMGLRLVRTLMDECRYARQGDENIVSLCKRLGPAGAVEERSP